MKLAALLAFAASDAAACDLALALAIDISGSVDRKEYAIQMDGLALALRDETVAAALVRAKASLLVLQWTGEGRQTVVLDWRAVTDHSALAAIADDITATPRRWRNYSTAIGEALQVTAQTFSAPAVTGCRRRVIDVSGDGASNEGIPPRNVRALLEQSGIVVNGLAIGGSEDGLTAYYRDHVISGPGAFVITADGFEDYPKQIKRKLLRETEERFAGQRRGGKINRPAAQSHMALID